MADTAKDEILNKIAKNLEEHPEKVEGLQAIYLFDITGDGGGQYTLTCDGTTGTIAEGVEGEPQCTITMVDEDFVEMIGGALNPQMAFMTGKLKVQGDIGLALKIQAILS